MKTVLFCVAYLSLHYGEIKQKLLTAPNKREALLQYLELDLDYWGSKSLGDIYDYVSDCDAFISAIEL